MISLSALDVGISAIVAEIKTEQDTILHKLFALGIVPGMPLILEQRFPTYVIKVGRSRAALDRETAQTIFVDPQIPSPEPQKRPQTPPVSSP
jgi:ferrous iron transport protein A